MGLKDVLRDKRTEIFAIAAKYSAYRPDAVRFI